MVTAGIKTENKVLLQKSVKEVFKAPEHPRLILSKGFHITKICQHCRPIKDAHEPEEIFVMNRRTYKINLLIWIIPLLLERCIIVLDTSVVPNFVRQELFQNGVVITRNEFLI